MKRHSFTVRLLKLLSGALGALGGLFCDFPGRTVAMYGMPQAEYKFSGAVRAADTKQPIAGIRLSVLDTLDHLEQVTVYSDSAGRYGFTLYDISASHAWTLRAEDVDGSQNGSFKDRDTLITISGSELNGAGGTVEKSVDLDLDAAGK